MHSPIPYCLVFTRGNLLIQWFLSHIFEECYHELIGISDHVSIQCAAAKTPIRNRTNYTSELPGNLDAVVECPPHPDQWIFEDRRVEVATCVIERGVCYF